MDCSAPWLAACLPSPSAVGNLRITRSHPLGAIRPAERLSAGGDQSHGIREHGRPRRANPLRGSRFRQPAAAALARRRRAQNAAGNNYIPQPSPAPGYAPPMSTPPGYPQPSTPPAYLPQPAGPGCGYQPTESAAVSGMLNEPTPAVGPAPGCDMMPAGGYMKNAANCDNVGDVCGCNACCDHWYASADALYMTRSTPRTTYTSAEPTNNPVHQGYFNDVNWTWGVQGTLGYRFGCNCEWSAEITYWDLVESNSDGGPGIPGPYVTPMTFGLTNMLNTSGGGGTGGLQTADQWFDRRRPTISGGPTTWRTWKATSSATSVAAAAAPAASTSSSAFVGSASRTISCSVRSGATTSLSTPTSGLT